MKMSRIAFTMFAVALGAWLIGFVYNIPIVQQIAKPVFWIAILLFIVAVYLLRCQAYIHPSKND